MRLQPAGIAASGNVAFDIDEVLHGEGTAGEQARCGALKAEAAVRTESAGSVLEVGNPHSAASATLAIA